MEVKLRESRGNRIKAACGQLVSDYNKGNDAPTSDSPEKMSPVIHKLSDNKADTTRGIRKENVTLLQNIKPKGNVRKTNDELTL